jgi:hypothetical protein
MPAIRAEPGAASPIDGSARTIACAMTVLRQSQSNRERERGRDHRQVGAHWQAPHLVTNPASDDAFRHAALEAVREWTTTAGLEAELRGRYPAVAVHARQLSAEPFVVWYVYRDGRWASSADPRVERGDDHRSPAAPRG